MLFLMLSPLALFLVAAAALHAWRSFKTRPASQAWQRWAEQRGYNFRAPQGTRGFKSAARVDGTCEEGALRLRRLTMGEFDGDVPRAFTQLELRGPSAGGADFEIAALGRLSRAIREKQGRVQVTGEPEFDAVFTLQCDDAQSARAALDAQARAELLRMPRPLWVEHAAGMSCVRWPGLETDTRQLDRALCVLRSARRTRRSQSGRDAA